MATTVQPKLSLDELAEISQAATELERHGDPRARRLRAFIQATQGKTELLDLPGITPPKQEMKTSLAGRVGGLLRPSKKPPGQREPGFIEGMASGMGAPGMAPKQVNIKTPTTPIQKQALKLGGEIRRSLDAVKVPDQDRVNLLSARRYTNKVRMFRPGVGAAVRRGFKVPLISAAIEASDLLAVLTAAKKEERGEKLSGSETSLLDAYATHLTAQMQTDQGMLDSAVEMAAGIPAYAGEFMATGGIYTGAKAAARKTLTKLVSQRVAEGVAGRVVGFALGGAAQATVMPMLVPEAVRRQIPRMEAAPVEGQQDLERVVDKGSGESFPEALAKAYGVTAVETISERTGSVAQKGMNVLKEKFLSSWLKKRGIGEMSDQAKAIAARAGWNGIVGEVFEEQVAKPFRNLIESQPLGTGFSMEDIATEALGIAIFGSAAKFVGHVAMPARGEAPPAPPTTETPPDAPARPPDAAVTPSPQAPPPGVAQQPETIPAASVTQPPIPETAPPQPETQAPIPETAAAPRPPAAPTPAPPKSLKDIAAATLPEGAPLKDLVDEAIRKKEEALAAKSPIENPRAALPPVDGPKGSETQLKSPAGDNPAQYRLVEADALQPSHDPFTFAKNPSYPADVQERQYHSNKNAQAEIMKIGQNIKPEMVINSDPTAINGPPQITPEGLVMGGNARSMALQRAYQSGGAASYREYLENHAEEFGLTRDDVRKMANPILVREIIDTPEDVEGLRRLGQDLNRSFTKELSEVERAVSAGKNLTRQTAEQITGELEGMGESGTLRSLMANNPLVFRDALLRDRVLQESDLPRYFTEQGALTDAGKDFVENTLLGSVVRDADLLQSLPATLKQKLERVVPQLIELGQRTDAWNIVDDVMEASRQIASAQARGISLKDLLGQKQMFEAGPSRRVRAIARVLAKKPKEAAAVFRRFASEARSDVPGQAGMFGPADPSETFHRLFEAEAPPPEKPPEKQKKQTPPAITKQDIPKKVYRIEEKGVDISSPDKPQGLYTSPANLVSPHDDLGGLKRKWDVNPSANVLTIKDFGEEAIMRSGAISSGLGVHAARQLLGPNEFKRLKNLSKDELLKEAKAINSSAQWERYFDKQEIMEGIGGVIAREKGYDAMWMPDSEAPDFSEFVALTEQAFVKDTPEPSPATAPKQTHRLVEAVYQILKAGEAIGNNAAFDKIAEQAYGSARTSGEWNIRQAYDALETGVNKYLIEDGKRLMDMEPEQALGDIRKILAKLPTQAARTKEQLAFQQFSTPPTLAFVANKVAGVTADDVMLEPSAGNGGLAVFAKAVGAEVHVNEVSPTRQKMLSEVGFDNVSKVDGEVLHAMLDQSIKPSVIVMNPPFSAGGLKGEKARNRNQYGFNHVNSALQRLEENGRLVVIMGGGQANEPEGGASIYGSGSGDWFERIANKYTVRANVRVEGKEYGKYGTTFAVRLIVIDKDGPTPGGPGKWRTGVVKRNVKTLEEAYTVLQDVTASRPTRKPEPAAVVPGGGGQGERAPSPREGQAGQRGPTQPGGTEGSRIPAPGSGVGGPPGAGGGRGGGAGSNAGGGPSGVGQRDLPAGQSQLPIPERQEPEPGAERLRGDEPGPRPEPTAVIPEPTTEVPERDAGDAVDERESGPRNLERAEPLDEVSEEEPESVFVTYNPSLKGAKHPGAIVESQTMATVPLPKITYRPHLPKSSLEGKKISAVQLEAVALVGQQNEIVLADGSRATALIGDGTGVGKGRIAAAILQDNWRQGRRRLVWVSEKWDLVQDAMRDINGIGAGELLEGVSQDRLGKFVISASSRVRRMDSWKGDSEIKHQGVLFTTYSMLRSESKTGAVRSKQLTDYLKGNDEGDGAYIIFDESHNLKNAVPSGFGKQSKTGKKVNQLLTDIPKLRTANMSATAATDVMNLGYLNRLGLWGAGTAFPGGFQEFAAEIAGGGLAAMELVARELKALGKYVSRTLSFKGVVYNEAEHTLNPKQIEMYSAAAAAWRKVLDSGLKNIQDVTNGGREQKRNFSTNFYGAQQRFFNLLITALKIPTAVSLTNKALAEGKSVVITLVNTNEASQDREKERVAGRQKETREKDEDIPEYDFGPAKILLDMVNSTYPVAQYQDAVADDGKPVKELVRDEKGNPVVNPEAVKARDALMSDLKENLQMPNNPLDELIEVLGGPSKIAELTGRKERMDPSTGKFVPRGDPGAKRADVNLNEMKAFQSGRKRVAILSRSAGTGISLHAGNDVENQQQRLHITLQTGWSADQQMQMFGRTHRTNQAQPPEYVLLHSNMGGEKRFISTIARRLGSLGALTKGQAKGGAGGGLLDKVNFESEQGRAAARTFYESLLRNNVVPGTNMPGIDILTELGMLKEFQGQVTVPDNDRNDVSRLLNRMLALDPKIQNPVYDFYYDIFEATVKKSIEDGTFDTGVRSLEGDEFTIKERRVIATDKATGAETFYYPVEIKKLTKRLSVKKMEKDLENPESRLMVTRRGGIRLVVPAKDLVGSDGVISKAFYVKRASYGKWTRVAAERFGGIELDAWIRKIGHTGEPLAWAKQEWEREYQESPPYEVEEAHLLGGAVMRFWNPIRDASQDSGIYTAADSDTKQRVVGVNIPSTSIRRLLERITGKASTVNAHQLVTDVLKNGLHYELEGNIRVARGKIGKEYVVRLVPTSDEVGDVLRGFGIQFEQRLVPFYYAPTMGTKRIMEKILEQYPVKASTDELKDQINRQRQDISEHTQGTMRAGLDPILLGKLIRLGVLHMRAGTRDYQLWRDSMMEDTNKAVRPHLKLVWGNSNRQFLELERNPARMLNSVADEIASDVGSLLATGTIAKENKPAARQQARELFPNKGEMQRRFDLIRAKLIYLATEIKRLRETQPEEELGRFKRQEHLQVSEEKARQLVEELIQWRRDWAMTGRSMNDAFSDLSGILPEILKYAKALPNITKPGMADKFYEFWINSLLSGPQTHVVNTVSNTLVRLMVPFERGTAAGIDLLRSTFTGTPREVFFGEVGADIYGAAAGIREGVMNGMQTFVTEERSRKGPGWVEGGRGKAIEGAKGKIARLPVRLLGAADEFFKSINYSAATHALAYRQAVAEGAVGYRRAMRIAAEVAKSPDKDIDDEAGAEMLYRVFQQDLGRVSKVMMRLRNSAEPFRYIVPFLRTPTNIGKYSLERTPFNFVRVLGKAAKKKKGFTGGKLSEELAKPALGSMIGAYAVLLAMEGLITGGGPDDPSDRAVQYEAGWLPYAVKVGDRYYSYQRLEPVSSLFGLAADLYERWDDLSSEEIGKGVATIVGSISRNITSKTYTTGIVDAMMAVEDPDRHGERWVQRLAGTLIPTGVAQVARTINPVFHRPGTVSEALKARVPGLSKQVAPRYGVFGEESKRAGGWAERFISPFYVSEITGDSVRKELARLEMGIGEPAQYLTIKGERHQLSQEQYRQYVTESGQAAHATVKRLMRSKRYRSAEDEDKEGWIRKAFLRERERARQGLRRELVREAN